MKSIIHVLPNILTLQSGCTQSTIVKSFFSKVIDYSRKVTDANIVDTAGSWYNWSIANQSWSPAYAGNPLLYFFAYSSVDLIAYLDTTLLSDITFGKVLPGWIMFDLSEKQGYELITMAK